MKRKACFDIARWLVALATVATALGTLSVGCGWKTGLDVDAVRARDAAVDGSVDGGMPFDTFPCRWSLGERVDISVGTAFTNLRGAVHGARDEAAVLADDGVNAVGARVTLDFTPRVLAAIDDAGAIGVAGHPDGWSSLVAPCTQVIRNDEFAFLATFELAPEREGGCRVEHDDPRFLDVTQVGGALDVAAIHHWFPLGETLTTSLRATGATTAATLRWDDRVLVAWVDERGIARARVSGPVTVFDAELASEASDVLITRDWFRPAAVIEVRHIDSTQLFRWPLDERTPTLLEELDVVADGLTSNETEAILSRSDGTLVAKPLSGTMIRLSDPPAEGDVIDARVVLRPGSSRGGLLYVHRDRDPRGLETLRFRPLVCNR